MAKQTDLVCIGAAILDVIMKGFNNEKINKTGYLADSIELCPGGEALNQSIAASHLGMNVKIVCGMAHDNASEILMKALVAGGVNTDHIFYTEGFKPPVALMVVGDNADRISVSTQAHRVNFRPDTDMSFMQGAKAVSLDSLFRVPFNDPELIFKVVSEAKAQGCAIYADTKLPNFVKLTLSDIEDSLKLVDCIFPNEREAEYYSGQTEPEAMADEFLKHGVKSVVVKLGGEGMLFKDSTETIRLASHKVDAVDATGAGDNLIAGFISMKNEGRSNREASVFANACGALSTTIPGGVNGVKNRQQVIDFLKSEGIDFR